MRLLIRLYPLHDMDLIPYKLDKSFRFGSLVKSALTAYAQGKDYVLPPVPKIDWSSFNYIPLDCNIDFKDAPELEQLFVGVRNRYKSAFVKAVLRNYLKNGDMSGFYNNVVVKKDFSQTKEDSEIRKIHSSKKNDMDKKRESFISKVREREEKEKSLIEGKIAEDNHYRENFPQSEAEKPVIIEKPENSAYESLSHKEIHETEGSYNDTSGFNPVEMDNDDELFDNFIEILNK